MCVAVCVCVYMWLCVTFHRHSEGVCGGAVDVEGSALVLSVVLQRDAVEVKPAVTHLPLAARLVQGPVLLLPFHLRSGSADTEIRTGISFIRTRRRIRGV